MSSIRDGIAQLRDYVWIFVTIMVYHIPPRVCKMVVQSLQAFDDEQVWQPVLFGHDPVVAVLLPSGFRLDFYQDID